MIKRITVILLFLFIASCKTSNPDYGSGPISLSPAVTNHYKNKYLKEFKPWMYFVNKSGTVASYLRCPEVDCFEEYI